MGRRRQELRGADNYAADLMLALREEHLEYPSELTEELRRAHALGFRSVVLVPHVFGMEIGSPEMLGACEHAVRAAKELDLGVWLHADIRKAHDSFLKQFPESRLELLVWAVSPVEAGRLSLPPGDVLYDRLHAVDRGTPELIAAYARGADQVEVVDPQPALEPGDQPSDWVATWDAAAVQGAEVAIFARVPLDTIDFASLDAVRFTQGLVLRLSKVVPEVFGVWSEGMTPPTPLSSWDNLCVSPMFFTEFQHRHSYDLRSRLPALAWDLEDSVRVRLDVSATWRDMAFRVQSMLRTEAAEAYGREVNVWQLGRRRPWDRLDPIRNAPDHFRFTAATQTTGITHAEFDDEESMAWGLALSRSLGKYHPDHNACSIAWPASPTWQQVNRYTGLMCAQSVRWTLPPNAQRWLRRNLTPGQVWDFGSRVGSESSPAGPGLPTPLGSPEQSHTYRCVGFPEGDEGWARAINGEFAWVGERTGFEFPRANVALIYNWQSGACFWDERADLYRQSLARLAHELTKQNLAFDVLSPELMTSAEDMTEAGGFTRREETYDVIVYPWPVAHTALDWEILLGYLEEGGRAILYGYPPQVAGEQDIANALPKLIGCGVPSAEAFELMRMPIEFEGQAVPVVDRGPVGVLEGVDDPFLTTTSGVPLGVANAAGTSCYLSYDAGLMTPSIIPLLLRRQGLGPLVRAPRGVFASLIGSKVVCVAKSGASLKDAVIEAEGASATIHDGCDLAIVDLESGEVEAFAP